MTLKMIMETKVLEINEKNKSFIKINQVETY